jgi:hypothetical protein
LFADTRPGIQPKRGNRKRTGRREAEIRNFEENASCKLAVDCRRLRSLPNFSEGVLPPDV